jgi:hypothetical protein
MTQLDRINPSEFAPVAQEEAEMVLGGLVAAGGSYTSSGSQPTIIDGKLQDVPEYHSGDPAA